MKALRLPATAAATLAAGQSLTLRYPFKGDPPAPDATLRPFEDLAASAKLARPVLAWGYELPPAGPSHGTLVYRSAKGEETERELSPGRCVTWRAPWQPGDRLWCRETWAELCREEECFWSDPYASPAENAVALAAHRQAHHYYEYRADTPGARYPGGWDAALLPGEWSLGPDVPRWRSSSTMPREAARLWVRVLEVRPERGDAGGWEWKVEVRRVEEEGSDGRK